jgi:DNA-binding transcriptional ArsR family regulator
MAQNDAGRSSSQTVITRETGLSRRSITAYLSAKEGKEGILLKNGLVEVLKTDGLYNRYSYVITERGRYALASGKITLEVNRRLYQMVEVLC